MIDKIVGIIGEGKPLFGARPYRAGENMKLFADINLAKNLLGWEPRLDLEDGLRRTIDYYKRMV